MTNPKHSLIDLEKIQAKKVGNLESLQYTADVDNGRVCHVGDLVADEREVKSAVVPDANSIKSEEVVLIASPELNYLPGTNREDFFNASGNAMRAYHLTEGDVFKVSSDAVTGTAAVDGYVVPQAGNMQLAAVANLSGGTRFAAKVIDVTETIGFNSFNAVTVQVVQV